MYGKNIYSPLQKTPQQWIDEGLQFQKTVGDLRQITISHEAAINCYEKALSLNPNFEAAWHNKGIALAEIFEMNEALKCFDKVTSINPKHEDAWNRKGWSFSAIKNSEEALKCFSHVLANINSKSINALRGKLSVCHDMKNYQGAVTCYDQMILLEPKHLMHHCEKAIVLCMLGKYDEAIQCCDYILNFPDQNKGYFLVAKIRILYMANKKEEARQLFTKSFERIKGNYEAWSIQIAIALDRGEVKSAEELRIKAIITISGLVSKENVSSMWSGMARTLGNDILKHYDQALKFYDLAISTSPRDCNHWANKSSLLEKLNRIKEAIECYDRAIDLDPNQTGLYKCRGILKIKNDELESAADDFKKLFALIEKDNSQMPKALVRQFVEDVKENLAKIADLKKEKAEKIERKKLKKEAKQRKKDEQRKTQNLQEKNANFELSLQELDKARKDKLYDLRTLNQKFQELETTASTQRNSNFFVCRGDFYFEEANNATNDTQKTALNKNALSDYENALRIDPFIEGLPSKIDIVKKYLMPTVVHKPPTLFFQPPAPPPNVGTKASLPERKDLSPEELAKLEEIKANLLLERTKVEESQRP